MLATTIRETRRREFYRHFAWRSPLVKQYPRKIGKKIPWNGSGLLQDSISQEMAFPANFPPSPRSDIPSLRGKIRGVNKRRGFYFRRVNRSRDALNLEYAERARSRAALECILQNATRVKRCRARFVCTCNTHVVLELPSGWERWVSNGKIPSVLLFRSLCSRNRQESCSNFIVKSSPLEGKRRRKKGWRQFTFVEQDAWRVYEDFISYPIWMDNGNRSGCCTQNSHVFVAKCRVRLFFIACTLVHLIRETDRGCGKRK